MNSSSWYDPGGDPRSAEFQCDGRGFRGRPLLKVHSVYGHWGLERTVCPWGSHFHCIKDHSGDTEACQLIDMDTVNSSGMEPENVGHLVNSYGAARTAFNINLPSRRLGLLSNGLSKSKQAQRLREQLGLLTSSTLSLPLSTSVERCWAWNDNLQTPNRIIPELLSCTSNS